MKLILFERRTSEKMIKGEQEDEDSCPQCSSRSVEPLEALTENIHRLKDDHGKPMVEYEARCSKCGAKWVDVFKREYPT